MYADLCSSVCSKMFNKYRALSTLTVLLCTLVNASDFVEFNPLYECCGVESTSNAYSGDFEKKEVSLKCSSLSSFGSIVSVETIAFS